MVGQSQVSSRSCASSRDDLRIEVVEARPVTADRATLEPRRRLVASADGELSTLRPGLSRQLAHDLLETWL